MHARSQRAEPARSAGGVLAKPTRSAGGTSWFALAPRWHQRGALVQRCAHCAPHSSTWGSSDLKDGCPLETCSSQDRDSLLPRVGLRSDAVMSNLLSSPQTPGGTAVSCYATSLPLPLSPSSSRPFPVRASVTSLKKKLCHCKSRIRNSRNECPAASAPAASAGPRIAQHHGQRMPCALRVCERVPTAPADLPAAQAGRAGNADLVRELPPTHVPRNARCGFSSGSAPLRRRPRTRRSGPCGGQKTTRRRSMRNGLPSLKTALSQNIELHRRLSSSCPPRARLPPCARAAQHYPVFASKPVA